MKSPVTRNGNKHVLNDSSEDITTQATQLATEMSEGFRERLDQFRNEQLDVASILSSVASHRQGSQFSASKSATGQQSLAQTLRARRELQEKIESERQSLGMMKQDKFRLMPKETDDFGTAFRMRPETPKINLLEI